MMKNKWLAIFALLFCGMQLSADNTFDEQGVKAVIDSFVEDWNQHDGKKMAALWAADGDLITPWGKVAVDHSAVEAMLTEQHKTVAKDSKMDQLVTHIRFMTPDLAFVDASAKIIDYVNSQKKPEDFKDLHVVYLMQRKNGRWEILSMRSYKLLGTLSS